MYPRPRLEAALQVAFLPSPQLETALRGFLLPEDQRAIQTTNYKFGQIVLKTVAERRFAFDHSDNEGIRFIPTDKAALARETSLFDDMAEEPIGVTGIGLHVGENHDIVVTFPLKLADEQRRRLGGVVLKGHINTADKPLVVYKRFDHKDILQDEEAIIHQAAWMHRTIQGYSRFQAEHLNSYVSPPFYVHHPHHTGAQLRRPRAEPS